MDTKSIIPQSDDRLFGYLLKESLVGLVDSGSNDPKNRSSDSKDIKLLLVVSGLILVVATEPFKVLLRRNIGKLSLSMPRLVVACMLYGIWAVILFYVQESHKYAEFKTALFAGCVFYAVFGAIILILGIIEYFKAQSRYNENPNDTMKHLYRGDSIYWGNLENKGWKLERIWLVAEPLSCFIIGLSATILTAFIQPILILLGTPILLSSISFWFNEWYQINNVWNVQSKKIWAEKQKNIQNQQYRADDGFSSVK